MDWETIAAVAAAVTAVLGAIAAVTGHLTKAWAAGRRWQARRKGASAASGSAQAAAPGIEQADGQSPQADRTLREGSGAVWIIYRREDAAGTAEKLQEGLGRRIGTENVLLSPEATDPSPASAGIFNEIARRSEVVLVLIGPGWLRGEDEYGRARLSIPDDPVRVQIQTALSAEVALIPVLVRGASIPVRINYRRTSFH